MIEQFIPRLEKASAPASTATDKLIVSRDIGITISDTLRALVVDNLQNGANVLTRASVSVNSPGRPILESHAVFLLALQNEIRNGADLTLTFTSDTPVSIPDTTVVSGVNLLTDVRGKIELVNIPDLQSVVRPLDLLLGLAIKAKRESLPWGMFVAMPFASALAFEGAVNEDTVMLRRAEMVTGWAYQKQRLVA
jgi:hypothetical protein